MDAGSHNPLRWEGSLWDRLDEAEASLEYDRIFECLGPAFVAALEGLVQLFSLPARLGRRLSCLIWQVPFR